MVMMSIIFQHKSTCCVDQCFKTAVQGACGTVWTYVELIEFWRRRREVRLLWLEGLSHLGNGTQDLVARVQETFLQACQNTKPFGTCYGDQHEAVHEERHHLEYLWSLKEKKKNVHGVLSMDWTFWFNRCVSHPSQIHFLLNFMRKTLSKL